jgi:hypothetical protein
LSAITIQFSRSAPPTRRFAIYWSEWICRLTHSPFSHVDWVMPDGNLFGASDSPDAPVLDGNPKGVAVRPPDYQAFAIRRNATIGNVAAEKVAAFEQFLYQQVGKHFDRAALRPSVFLSFDYANRDWRTPDEWYCAELITRALEVAGVVPWPILVVKNRVTAADLLLIINPLIDVEAFRRPVV